MAISTTTLTDGSIVIELGHEADWNEFAADNHDGLTEEYGSVKRARAFFDLNGTVTLGGGAAPHVGVFWADNA